MLRDQLLLATVLMLVSGVSACGNRLAGTTVPAATRASFRSFLTDRPTPYPASSPLETDEAESSSALVLSWVRAEPCSPPCWEGITPGVSTVTDTIDILGAITTINSVRGVEVLTPDDEYQGTIEWAGVDARGSISYSGNGLVYRIILDTAGRLTIQDVVDAFGEPSHIYAAASPAIDVDVPVIHFDVVYLSKGIGLGWNGGDRDRPAFDRTWSTFHVYFFEPGRSGFSGAWGNPKAGGMRARGDHT